MKILFCAVLSIAITQMTWGQLTVKTQSYGSKLGYIDYAVLVVEPHGGYVEQSLYLTYSDHNQFNGNPNVEIVHRFQLPANSAVNDMWLWIGDSVMQAIMLSTWKAQAIYDSITSSLHDPALLAKHGNIYDLHIFPLESGRYRRVKINLITPTRWFGTEGVAELPIQMLLQNNAQTKPLHILFRTREHVWGKPYLKELSGIDFHDFKDTNGYSYSYAEIPDIGNLSSLTVGYTTGFNDGQFFASTDYKNEGSYFQLGFDPKAIFPVQVDSTSKRILFGLDLSGRHYKNNKTFIPNLQLAMLSATKEKDSVALIAVGAGDICPVTTGWVPRDSIVSITNRFANSDCGKRIFEVKLPHILYAENYAETCWKFPGLEDLATYRSYSSLFNAIKDWQGADVIAAYKQGSEHAAETKTNWNFIRARVDSFLNKGGRLLTYYDKYRVNRELLASNYIDSLTAVTIKEVFTPLLRDTTGNFGLFLPETFLHYEFNYLKYATDPDVKVEMRDTVGRPVIISKRIGNGLLVVSSIWSFRDDGAQVAQIGIPLLGLNSNVGKQSPVMLTALLDAIKNIHSQTPVDNAIVISNSDSLVLEVNAQTWAWSYINSFPQSPPKFTTINMLNGSGYIPPSITVDQVMYYGSGYLLYSIAKDSHGRHFESHLYPWNTIISLLYPYSIPKIDSLNLTATVDGGSGQLMEMREVDPEPSDPNKARFFIGRASLADSIEFHLSAKFAGIQDIKTLNTRKYLNHDTTTMDPIVRLMLGNEHINDMFSQKSKDTSAIVSLAMRYRLLCDFTAFIALEPNDTLHFMRNPYDETKLLDIEWPQFADINDSIMFAVAPNPFSARTTIGVRFLHPSRISIVVYNVLGQRVYNVAEDELVDGEKYYQWTGMDAHSTVLHGGTYFIQLLSRDIRSNEIRSTVRRLIFLR